MNSILKTLRFLKSLKNQKMHLNLNHPIYQKYLLYLK
jgi:hypothetical protein